MADFLPATIESIRPTLVGKGILSEADLDATLAACRRHLADPDTVSTSFLTAQVWGRKRIGPRGGPPSAPGPGGSGGA